MAFETTRWSIIAAALAKDSSTSRQALEELCKIYWFPLYSFVRGKGYHREEAEDLTQEFLCRFIEKENFAKVDREKGRFRSFFLTSARNFLADEWDKGQAQKRGGGAAHFSLDFGKAEGLVADLPHKRMTAEEMFDYHWAKATVANALRSLEEKYKSRDQEEYFQMLRPYLGNSEPTVTYAETGAVLNMSEGAVKVAVHRMRKRYRETLETEVADTLADCVDLNEEVRYLIDCLSS